MIYGSSKGRLQQFYNENKMSEENRREIVGKYVDKYYPIFSGVLSYYKSVPIPIDKLLNNKWTKYTNKYWGTKWDARQVCFYFNREKKDAPLHYYFINDKPPIQWLNSASLLYPDLKFVLECEYNYNTKIIFEYKNGEQINHKIEKRY